MRFRFTIRDLLWLTLVVALCAAWWLDHYRFRLFLETTVVLEGVPVGPAEGRGPQPEYLKEEKLLVPRTGAEVFDEGRWR